MSLIENFGVNRMGIMKMIQNNHDFLVITMIYKLI